MVDHPVVREQPVMEAGERQVLDQMGDTGHGQFLIATADPEHQSRLKGTGMRDPKRRDSVHLGAVDARRGHDGRPGGPRTSGGGQAEIKPNPARK